MRAVAIEAAREVTGHTSATHIGMGAGEEGREASILHHPALEIC